MMRPAEARCGSLEGMQVVVTRPEGAEGPLTRLLTERGARVLHWPVVAFEPLEDPAPLDEALARLSSYDWLVFTSPRAVAAVTVRTAAPGDRPRVAAVGEATAKTLAEAGWRVDLTPEEGGGAALLREFGRLDCEGARILFPATQIARATVPEGLEALGANVEQVVAYRTERASLDRAKCLRSIDQTTLSILTFASPSAVDGLESILGAESFRTLLEACPAVVIGPTTAQALEKTGFAPSATAEPTTLAGLVKAVEAASQREES